LLRALEGAPTLNRPPGIPVNRLLCEKVAVFTILWSGVAREIASVPKIKKFKNFTKI
jgi:hypothetical protein